MLDSPVNLARIIERELLAIVKHSHTLDRQQFFALLRSRLRRFEPDIARTLRDAQLQGYLTQAMKAVKALPTKQRFDPPEAETRFELPPHVDDGEPLIRFPQIIKAAQYLRTRIDYQPEEFKALAGDAQRLGFTIARLSTEDSVRKVRDAIATAVESGGASPKEFRSNVADAIKGSGLSDPQIDALYRTHVGRAQAAGQLAALEHPLVADEFPYRMYSATHDGRVRPEHLIIETLGLNGTAVFRSDDPIWEKWYPPCGWNCRCTVIALTIEDAASYGVKEAIRWMKTGIPPESPQWVKPFPFELPRGWVPTGRSLELAA